MIPVFTRVKVGWAAIGDGWAVFGRTMTEARQRFREAERKHAEIGARPLHEDEPVEGAHRKREPRT